MFTRTDMQYWTVTVIEGVKTITKDTQHVKRRTLVICNPPTNYRESGRSTSHNHASLSLNFTQTLVSPNSIKSQIGNRNIYLAKSPINQTNKGKYLHSPKCAVFCRKHLWSRDHVIYRPLLSQI